MSTFSVVRSPEPVSTAVPFMSPGLPGMVTAMSPLPPLQDSLWMMLTSSPTSLVAKEGSPCTDWNWSMTTVMPDAVVSTVTLLRSTRW